MATLHIRNVPDELYRRIRERAAREQRSLNAEVVVLLEQATREDSESLDMLIEQIQRRRARVQQERGGNLPSSVDLIREDRAR